VKDVQETQDASEAQLAPRKQLPNDDSDSESVHFEDMDWEPSNPVSKGLHAIHRSFSTGIDQWSSVLRVTTLCAVFAAYNAYFLGSIVHSVGREDVDIGWCDGTGFLIIMTVIVYWSLLYYHVIKKYWGEAIYEHVMSPIGKMWDALWKQM
jgi:hypothetical protein